MNNIKRLIKEILDIKSKLTQEKTKSKKVWVKNKESGNVYEVSADYYESHKTELDIPDKKQILKQKKTNSVQGSKPDTGTKVEPKPTKDLAKRAVAQLDSVIDTPVTKKSTKKKTPVQKVSISDGFTVPDKEREHISKLFESSQVYLQKSGANNSDMERFNQLKNNVTSLVSQGSSKQQKLQALTTLVQLGLIQTNDHDPSKKLKLYFSDTVTAMFPDKSALGVIRYKSISSSGKPNQMTRDICLFAMQNKIEIPIRGGGSSKVQGEFNQRGTVAILDPSQANVASAKQQRDLLESRAGKAKTEKVERCNKAAANKILQALGGKKLLRVQQVGNLGKAALMDRGIDDKKDPTDIIAYYEDQNGQQASMKISMKIYKNINAIAVKGAGISNAAKYYLGQQASFIDEKMPEMIKANDFREKNLSPDERVHRFKRFQQQYIALYKDQMQKLVDTEWGQQKLLNMWREVHGCGTNTWTCVTNVTKQTAEMRPPDYYCKPKLPFVVKGSGAKISVQLAQKGPKFLDIMVARSTDWGTPSLKFLSRSRKMKDPNAIPKKKSRSKKANVSEQQLTKAVYNSLVQMIKG